MSHVPFVFDLHLSPLNQSPVANVGGPYVGLEGAAVAFDGSLSFDPEHQSVLYAWTLGDGSTAETAAFDHVYVDNGVYTVRVVVADPLGASGEATTTATIANVAPSVHLDRPAVIRSGETFTLHATLSDPGTADRPWRYRIEWDSGTPTQGSTEVQGFPIAATSPRYCATGARAVSVSVTDKDGGTGSVSVSLGVSRMEVPINVLAHSMQLGARGTLPVAVLGTSAIDATQLDLQSVTLGSGVGIAVPVSLRGNGKPSSGIDDVNDDGRDDLVLHFDRETLVSRL